MKRSKRIYLLLLLLVSTCAVHAEKADTIHQMQQRIAALENYKADLQLQYNNRLDEAVKQLQQMIDKKTETVEDVNKKLSLLGFVGVPATLIALIGVYIAAIKKSKKYINDRIVQIVEQDREQLIKVIETQAFDSKLKNTKEIVVLSKTSEGEATIKKVFQKFGFKKLKFRTIDSYREYPEADLIVFNNVDGQFDQALIDEYIEKTDDNTVFVAYTTVNLKRHERINFANQYFTLYHNLLTTLKYAELLKITNE